MQEGGLRVSASVELAPAASKFSRQLGRKTERKNGEEVCITYSFLLSLSLSSACAGSGPLPRDGRCGVQTGRRPEEMEIKEDFFLGLSPQHMLGMGTHGNVTL